MIKVDKEVEVPDPLPDPNKFRTAYRKYPWHEMAVGDSFEIPTSKRASVVASYKRLRPKVFTTRKVSETAVRVWRVK